MFCEALEYKDFIFMAEQLRKPAQPDLFECRINAINEFVNLLNNKDRDIDYEELIEEINDMTGPGYLEIRQCDECHKYMASGYILGDGDYYYCSDKCLSQIFSEGEIEEYFLDEYLYFTEWY